MSLDAPVIGLQLDTTLLRPIIQAAVAEAVAQVGELRRQTAERFALTEREAASLLGLERHQLRDERTDGRIEYVRSRRGRVLYTPAMLEKYLAERTTREPARPA